MLNRVNSKKTISLALCFAIIISLCSGMKGGVTAGTFEKIEITINTESPIKITNEEGETIIIDEYTFGKVSGTMEILEDKKQYGTPNVNRVLLVRKSSSYTIEQTVKGNNFISFDDNTNDGFVSLNTSDKCKAMVSLSTNSEITLEGNVQEYGICTSTSDESGWYEIGGILYKPISMREEGNQMFINGALGKTDMIVESSDGKLITEGRYYLFGEETVLEFDAKKTYVKNAVKLNEKEKNRPVELYVRPVNNNKNIFLSWTKVKKAKSYIVYKKDNKTGKYKKVAIRNGKETNYYTEVITDDNVYEYKVMAKSKKEGKGKKIGKLSYGVKAVSMTNNKGNALSVNTNKKNISVRKGKRIVLNAKITHNERELLDKKIRWCSSNKKVVRIDKKTGKLRAIKKENVKCGPRLITERIVRR